MLHAAPAQVTKKASASGDSVPQSSIRALPMDHIGTQGGTSEVPIPLAALSGNECFSLSLRLCFSNDVSWLDDWSLDHTDKNFGPDLPLLFEIDEMWSVDSRKIIKIVATRCQISRLKCTKFDFGWQQLDFVGLLDYF